MYMSGIPEIVLVDDENRVTQSLEREIRMAFGSEEFRITRFENPEEAAAYTAPPPDNLFLVISDLRMPHMSGSELLAKVRESAPEVQTILLTAYSDIENIQKAISASIQSLLFKPWTREALASEISKARDIWTIRKQNNTLTRRIEDMLRETGEFQAKLFSFDIPMTSEVEIDLAYQPMAEYGCGGDFCDFRTPAEGGLLVLLGDVTGHGTKSAMIAGMIKTGIDALFSAKPELMTKPDLLMNTMNAHFCKMLEASPETLIGLTALYVNASTKLLAVATAGMPALIHLRDGKPEALRTPNPMLGAFPKAEFYKTERVFLPGDRVLLHTDGLVESVPHFFTVSEELENTIVSKNMHRTAEALVEDFRMFIPENHFTDDVTLIAIDNIIRQTT